MLLSPPVTVRWAKVTLPRQYQTDGMWFAFLKWTDAAAIERHGINFYVKTTSKETPKLWLQALGESVMPADRPTR